MQHPLRKAAIKAPNFESQAAADAKERLTQYIDRWDVQAVIKGTTDAAAPLQAAKGLLALMVQLQQHRSICKRAEVRQQYGKQLSAALLSPLLSSSNKDAISTTLQALQEHCRLLPGLLPLELAEPLVQLSITGHFLGAPAAKLLTEQLTHWRISHVLPVWCKYNATQQLLQQMQKVPPLSAQHCMAVAGNSSGAGSMLSLEMCSSYLTLLARLVSLAEQQLVQQLTADVDSASSFLQVLITACQQQQQHGALSLAQYSVMLDSCCQLLAALSRTAAVVTVLQSQERISLGVLELLHRVLQRPCDCTISDESAVQRWRHAAQAAATPVFWLPSAAAAAGRQEALLSDVVLAAASTVISTRRSIHYGSTVSNSSATRGMQQLETAAVLLLTVALTPPAVPFGSRRRVNSRFVSVLLSSDDFNTVLHDLVSPIAVKFDVVSCAPTAAACSSSKDASSTVVMPALRISLSGVLLKLICLQYGDAYQSSVTTICGTRNTASSSRSNKLMHPDSLAKYLLEPQSANSIIDHMDSSVLFLMLQLVLCHTALQPMPQQPAQLGCSNPGTDPSSSSSVSDRNAALCSTAAPPAAKSLTCSQGFACKDRSPDRIWARIRQHWSCLHVSVDTGIVHVFQSNNHDCCCCKGGRRFSRLDEEVIVSRVVLSVAADLHKIVIPSSAEATLVLQTAVTTVWLVSRLLKRMLPTDSSNEQQQQQQEQQQVSLSKSGCNSEAECSIGSKVQLSDNDVGYVECLLAALQSLVLLSRYVTAQLPNILACIRSSSGSLRTEADAKAAGTLLQDLKCSLNSALRQALSKVVASRSAVHHHTQPDAAGNSSSSSIGITPEALLQHHLENELRCCAAAALASCFGQLGSSSSKVSLLAAARECGSEFLDAVLLLPSKDQQQQQQHKFPIYASVIAAGCPVLGKQLLSAAAAAGNSTRIQLSLSAAVDPAALQRALNYIYTGAAAVHTAGLAAHLAIAVPALTYVHGCPRLWHTIPHNHQPEDVFEQAVAALLAQQKQNMTDLQVLGKLAKKLQLPLLAALCQQGPLPYTGLQLHPRLDSLLPQQVLLLPLQFRHPQLQQQQQQQVKEEQQQQFQFTCSSNSNAQLHTSCRDYLEQITDFSLNSSTSQLHIHHSLLQVGCKPAAELDHHESSAVSHFADVLLAAPAWVVYSPMKPAPCQGSCSDPQYQQQQQQQQQEEQEQEECVMMSALLPAQQLLLSRSCQYFEALLSQRWQTSDYCPDSDGDLVISDDAETNGQQQQQQQGGFGRQLRVITVPEADVHVLAALQLWLYTGQLEVKLPENINPILLPQNQQQQQQGFDHKNNSVMTADSPECTSDVQEAMHEPHTGSSSSVKMQIKLHGCSTSCHISRTLLRLWRCAELMLLPDLQQQCLAAVAAADEQQSCCGCCLALLSDCEQLGVAAAADDVITDLIDRFGKDSAMACPEWQLLSSAVQSVLLDGWLDKQRQ